MINKASNGMQRSSEFLTTANSDPQVEATTVIRPGTTLRELEAEYEKLLRQREVARVSASN